MEGASIFCARCERYGYFAFERSVLETICTECGLLLESYASSEISEGRTFGDGLDNIELHRVGGPHSPYAEGSSTAIFRNPDGKKGEFGWVGNQGSITECNLTEAFKIITTVADRLNLVATVKDHACELYKKLDDYKPVKGRRRDAIIASCLYFACQQERDLRRTVEEICIIGELSTEEEIDRETEFVIKRLITIQAINLLRRFCYSLGMSDQAIKAVEEAAKKYEKLDIRRGTPVTIAAGIVYIVAQLSKKELLLKDISDATGIADDTIQKAFEVLYPQAPKIIPPYSDKDGLMCLCKPSVNDIRGLRLKEELANLRLKCQEMSTNNKRVILLPTRVPDDLINEIIMRLPAISNFRFKCVSKQWFSLNLEALKLKSQTNTAVGIFYGTHKGVRDARAKYVKTEKDQNDDSCIDGTLSFLPEHRQMRIRDSCNGLLLCECEDELILPTGALEETSRFYVCNPATRKWIKIPNISMNTAQLAILDFNPLVSEHFKVIIIMLAFPLFGNFKVFSSKTGEWSASHLTDPLRQCITSVPELFYEGLIFAKDYREKEIIGFDLKGKVCSRTEFPGKPSVNNHTHSSHLYQSGGCLHYYCCCGNNEVWVWKLESGSWLLKSCFSAPFPRRYIECIKFHPIKDDVIFLQINDRVYSYNIKTSQGIKLCSYTSERNYCLYSPFYLDFSGSWWKKMNG